MFRVNGNAETWILFEINGQLGQLFPGCETVRSKLREPVSNVTAR